MEHNLNLYHIFYTVARCGNISAAANQLFISQPAISKSISRLEQNLGVTLFTRSSRGVSLTMEGEILFRQAETAFTAIREGEDRLRRAGELGMGHLSIGVSTTLCRYVLLPWLRSFIHENPHIRISVSCQSSYQTIRALENGDIDLGLIGEPARYGKLHFYPLQEIQDIFVATDSYLENLKKRMRINHPGSHASIYSHATLLLLDRNNLTRQYVDNYLSPEILENDRIIEVTTMDLLIEFAKIGLGIGSVIKEFVNTELTDGHLTQIPLNPPIPKRTVGFVHYPNRSSSALNSFLAFAAEQKPLHLSL